MHHVFELNLFIVVSVGDPTRTLVDSLARCTQREAPLRAAFLTKPMDFNENFREALITAESMSFARSFEV